MAQQLKSWESPRRKGRNDKGKGGAARARQIRKQQQMMRQKLKGESPDNKKGNRYQSLFLFYLLLTTISKKPKKTKTHLCQECQKIFTIIA